MHFCPDCGQACYCHGDIDDHENANEAEACVHDCEVNYPVDEDWELDRAL
jgi:hypothetical protein